MNIVHLPPGWEKDNIDGEDMYVKGETIVIFLEGGDVMIDAPPTSAVVLSGEELHWISMMRLKQTHP